MIYLDHSATTPIDRKILLAMRPYFSQKYGNPSSIHSFGQAALNGVDKARTQVAEFLGSHPEEIIFTSGATEANNLAIKGLVKALRRQGRKKIHIITSAVEHSAVLEPCLELETEDVKITYLPVKSNSVVDVEKFQQAIRPETALVSIMYVNSEVGSIQPIREIGKIIKKTNERREREWNKRRPSERGERPQPIYFHTDATQAVNFFNCNVDWHYLDFLSLSGHKIYGPKGIGLLYRRQGVPLEPIIRGGHQENNFRSGTLNVPGIVGLGAALAALGKGERGESSAVQAKQNKKIARLRDMLVEGIKKNVPEAILNTDRKKATPAHAHFTFPGAEGEALLISLDLAGIAVSTGSACASGNLKPSHVLLAMGIKQEIAHSSIRFTVGKYNTAEEIRTVIKKLPSIVARLRQMNPLYKNDK